jgi:hypothetical protein
MSCGRPGTRTSSERSLIATRWRFGACRLDKLGSSVTFPLCGVALTLGRPSEVSAAAVRTKLNSWVSRALGYTWCRARRSPLRPPDSGWRAVLGGRRLDDGLGGLAGIQQPTCLLAGQFRSLNESVLDVRGEPSAVCRKRVVDWRSQLIASARGGCVEVELEAVQSAEGPPSRGRASYWVFSASGELHRASVEVLKQYKESSQQTYAYGLVDHLNWLDANPEWDCTMPLFPSTATNPDLRLPLSQGYFQDKFGAWIETLGLVGITTHRTRATLATSLLNDGAGNPVFIVQLAAARRSFTVLATPGT